MSYWVQFILALPLALGGLGCFVWAMLSPGTIGLLRLSFFAFTVQFCIGPVLNLFTQDVPLDHQPADIITAFGAIYLFYLGVGLVALVWRSKLDPILMVRARGLSHERGIFACLTEASLRASMLWTIGFYLLVTVVRIYMFKTFNVGLSGTATDEQTLALPYWALAVHKTFASLGLTFVYVAITKIAYRQSGMFWCVLIIVAEVLNTFIKGRRRLASLAMLMFFALLMKHGRLKMRHAVLASIALVVLWRFAFPMFYNMRTQWLENPEAPVTRWVQSAWTDTVTGGVYGESQARYSKSFTGRLNALVETYNLGAALNAGAPPAGGEFLKSAFLNAVPRVLFPSKLAAIRTDDDLMNQLYHVGGQDLVSNLPAFGLADFGVLGGLIYGALFALSLRLVELMLKVLFQRSPVGAMAFFSGMAFDIVLQVEIPPGSFLTTIRLVVMIYIIVYVWTSIFGTSQRAIPEDYPLAEPVAR